MKELKVATGNPYQIIIEHGILKDSGKQIKAVTNAKRVMVISDSNVFPLYGNTVTASLKENGFTVYTHIFTAGEENKRLSTIEKMYYDLAENGFTRSDIIVALGGGVTGDMAGFAAATYLRGINFVQIPTSLLAQVDSSVGGKTGVDIPQGKNLVGAFHQPLLVLIDPDTLNTLSPLLFADGMGEVIKYGCIKSSDLFTQLSEQNAQDNIDDIIYQCVSIKRDVVEIDEKDHGERALLNFGHTLGHALEKIHNFSDLTHGQGVAIGMVMMAQAGENNGITEKGTAERIAKLCEKYGLPTSDSTDIHTIALATAGDKKSSGDSISLVVLDNIGKSHTHKIAVKDLESFVAQ